MATTLERLETLEANLTELTKKLSGFEGMLNRVFVTAYQTHQGHQELVQTIEYLQDLSASIAEAAEVKVDDIRKSLNEVRASKERKKVEILVSQNILTETSEATPESVVAVSETFILNDGTQVQESPFKTIELTSANITEELRTSVVGKRVGDTFSVTYDDGTLTCTIQNIYTINKTTDTAAN
jgi:hypothetical protein